MGGPKGATRNNGQTILTAHEKQFLSIYINKRLNVFSFKKNKKNKKSGKFWPITTAHEETFLNFFFTRLFLN